MVLQYTKNSKIQNLNKFISKEHIPILSKYTYIYNNKFHERKKGSFFFGQGVVDRL